MGLHYEASIDFGAHPNHAGTFANVKDAENEGKRAIEIALLQGNVRVIMHSLNSATAIGLGAARIFGLLNKTLYADTGLGNRGVGLARAADLTFAQFKG